MNNTYLELFSTVPEPSLANTVSSKGFDEKSCNKPDLQHPLRNVSCRVQSCEPLAE